MSEDFADVVRWLDKPKSNADLRRAIEAVRSIARDSFDEAVEVLRDPSWDRPVELVSRWGRAPLKEQIWRALLRGASSGEVERLWFLAEQPDVYMRKHFVADAIATGHPELLERARALLADGDQEVREYTAIGLRDAMAASSSQEYIGVAAKLLLDYMRAFPKDSDIARMMALHRAGAEMASEAERLFAEASRLRPDADWYVVGQGDLGWGDYGAILVHGMAGRIGRDPDGQAQIERTGPFVPPITLPGSDVLAVTEEGRTELESSGLVGFEFRPLVVSRVVRLPWHEWDLDADDPAKYPAGGEPENYILGRKHIPELARTLPAMVEVSVQQFESVADLPTDRDLVRLGRYRLLASRRAQEWIAERWGRWIQFANFDV